MADAAASKSAEGNIMGVQVPSPAPFISIYTKRLALKGERKFFD